MFNMISAEIYKTYKRLYSRLFLLICAVLVLAFCVLMRVTVSEMAMTEGREALFGVMTYLMVVPFFLAVVTSDIVFSDENKHNTMKNVVAFGYTRTQIYFSKLVTSLINFIVMAGIILVVALVSVLVLFPAEGNWLFAMNVFLISFVASLPLWLSQVALCIAVWCNIRSSTFGTFLVIFISYILPQGLNMMTMITDKKIYSEIAWWFPGDRITDILNVPLVTYAETESGFVETYAENLWAVFKDVIGSNCLTGFTFFAIVMIAGWLLFGKREIK